VALRGLLSPTERVCADRIQKLREGRQLLPVSPCHAALAVGGVPRDSSWLREDFAVLLDLLRKGKIHPVVAERLPLGQARRAHELLERSASRGELVLVP
jgi:NADPH:quinone reductase-like Zn-dependent oxidoreductase